jgi:hypothetical protein
LLGPYCFGLGPVTRVVIVGEHAQGEVVADVVVDAVVVVEHVAA